MTDLPPNEKPKRLRALRAGIKTALTYGDDQLAAKLTSLHDAAAAGGPEAPDPDVMDDGPAG